MEILQKIVRHKQEEVAERKALYPTKLLERSIYFRTKAISLKRYILNREKSGIIAEIKTKSPSLGAINMSANVKDISIEYMRAGASALSVLTDNRFFGGNMHTLSKIRDYNYCPILQKDFIIDEYQIVEAKSFGADAILLISACLDKKKIDSFSSLAKSLGLEVLLEIEKREDLNMLNSDIELIGINNRNLRTFETDIGKSITLSQYLPPNLVKISESGIQSAEDILMLRQRGFDGFLIGELFMKSSNPGKTCRNLISHLQDQNSFCNGNIKEQKQAQIKD